jgi:cyclic pyranopterin monophosphate synthase
MATKGGSTTGALTHVDDGGGAHMVDVSAKDDTIREATARARITMLRETLALIQADGLPKGDVFATAKIAATMSAKRTSDLIPMCHPLMLTGIDVALRPQEAQSSVEIEATVRTTGKTGVEMEALVAVSIAALTIYDMCKAVDRSMRVEDVRLVRKTGGKSGEIVLE